MDFCSATAPLGLVPGYGQPMEDGQIFCFPTIWAEEQTLLGLLVPMIYLSNFHHDLRSLCFMGTFQQLTLLVVAQLCTSSGEGARLARGVL